jgi:hypothetical protein
VHGYRDDDERDACDLVVRGNSKSRARRPKLASATGSRARAATSSAPICRARRGARPVTSIPAGSSAAPRTLRKVRLPSHNCGKVDSCGRRRRSVRPAGVRAGRRACCATSRTRCWSSRAVLRPATAATASAS